MMFGVPDKVRRAVSAVSDWHGERDVGFVKR